LLDGLRIFPNVVFLRTRVAMAFMGDQVPRRGGCRQMTERLVALGRMCHTEYSPPLGRRVRPWGSSNYPEYTLAGNPVKD
jgi:hypothetical protein